LTPLKSQTDFTSPFSSFKEKIPQKYFNGKYPHTYKYLKQKKVGSCLDLIFGFSGVHHIAETDFGDFRSDYLGEYDAICKTVLGTCMGLIDEKNRESKISCNCPFKSAHPTEPFIVMIYVR
jgi:hypothetical protein